MVGSKINIATFRRLWTTWFRRVQAAGFGMLGLACFLAVAPGASVHAADYRSQIELGTSFLFDDNRRLASEDKQSASRVLIAPVWTNRLVDERYTFDVVGALTAVQSFDDDVEQDRIDYRGGLDFTYRYPVSTLKISGNFARQSQLDAQFEDSGVLGFDNTQKRYSGSIGWETQLSEVTSLSIDTGIQNQRFSGRLLQNFLSYTASLGLNRVLSERWSGGAFVSGQHQQTENLLFGDTTTGSAFLSSNYSLSEALTLSAQAGVITIHNDFDSTTDWTAEFGATYNNKGWTIDVSARRDFLPGGNGTVRDGKAAVASFQYQFSSRLSVRANGQYRESEIFASEGRDKQISAGASMRWQITENLNMDATYTFRDQELNSFFVGATRNATTNAVQIRLRYVYPPNGLSE